MTPGETRLLVGLALAAPASALLAALSTFEPGAARWRWAVVLAGIACAVTAVALSLTRWSGVAPADVTLFTWSPLGLYGVVVELRPQPYALLLAIPPLALAALGLAGVGRRAAASGEALALLAVGGASLALIAGDLVSLVVAVAIFFVASTAVLWSVAGEDAAGRRALVISAAALALMTCILVLGKVNGLFALSQLSTAGFTTAPFLGMLLAAAVAAPVPPFHRWLLRIARRPLAPALGLAGAVTGFALLMLTFQVTAGQFALSWQRSLGALAWLAAVITTGIALTRRAAPLRLAALLCGRTGLGFAAASVATPAALAAAGLYGVITLPLAALLWLVSLRTAAVRARPETRLAPARRPGFWLYALLLAGAVGFPGTAGGLARGELIGAVTAVPTGDQLLRIPVLLLDVATLVVGAGLLWRRVWFGRLSGWRGWAVVAAAVGALVLPAAFPAALVGRWFQPAAMQAVGTAGPPFSLDIWSSWTAFSGVLAAAALWALLQSLRGREWLPAPVHALIGIGVIGWAAAWSAWRAAGYGSAPLRALGAIRTGVEGLAERLVALLRPLEERYYAAGAVMLAVAVIYVIGR